MYTVKKEFDRFGNLILYLDIEQMVVDVDSTYFQKYKNHFTYHIMDDKAFMIRGSIEEYRYDENNNEVENISTYYQNAGNMDDYMLYTRHITRKNYKYYNQNLKMKYIL